MESPWEVTSLTRPLNFLCHSSELRRLLYGSNLQISGFAPKRQLQFCIAKVKASSNTTSTKAITVMGWKATNGKQELPSAGQSIEIDGHELVDQIILNTQSRDSSTEEDGRGSRLREHATITVVGQILRVLGDKLENMAEDTYKIINYGRV